MNSLAAMATWCAAHGEGLADPTTDDLIFEVVVTHVYAPTGNTAAILRTLRDNPARAFTSAELGKLHKTLAKQIPAKMTYAVQYGLVTYDAETRRWQFA